MKINFFKEHIDNYENRNGLSFNVFAISILWLWAMLILSFILVDVLFIRIILLIVGICVTIHLVIMSKQKKRDSDL